PGAAAPAELSARPTGVRDLYTWQSRRVRLHHDGRAVTGVVLGYGDPLTPHNRHDREPMTAWRRSPAQEKKLRREVVYLPRTPDPTRAAWRGVDALVTGETPGAEQRGEAARVVRPRVLDWVARLAVRGPLPSDLLIRTRTVGLVYGTQQSVIDEVVDDAVPLPVVLLDDEHPQLGRAAVAALRRAEAAVTALGDLAGDLAEAAGSPTDGPRGTARDLAFGELGPHYLAWLTGLHHDHDPREREATWQRTAHRVLRDLGRGLVTGAGSAAREGRVVTTRAGTEVWLCADSAHLRFLHRLRRELPLPHPGSGGGATG
ncbi:type I-E CRISPR-associated protein Cse1/CasA, partial [Streptomyces alkaliphilus]|uniref:type I-E CRISPR-associated protein Cse1/CasA n=1 Tax=Streptomyces alkaliphilus TaxID=1472722 RepID=UPI00117E7F6D